MCHAIAPHSFVKDYFLFLPLQKQNAEIAENEMWVQVLIFIESCIICKDK